MRARRAKPAAPSPAHRFDSPASYPETPRRFSPALACWEDTLRYLYLPRLKNRDVLAQAIRTGAGSRDFFGTAYGQSGETFEGFQLGSANVQVDDTLLLIEPEAADSYAATHRPSPAPPGGQTPPGTAFPPAVGQTPQRPVAQQPGGPKSFHGTEVTAATAKVRLVQFADEIIAVLS